MSNRRLQRTRKKRFLTGGKKEKKNRIQCPNCGTKFSVNKLRGKVRCPECKKEIIFGERKNKKESKGWSRNTKIAIGALGVVTTVVVGIGIGSLLGESQVQVSTQPVVTSTTSVHAVTSERQCDARQGVYLDTSISSEQVSERVPCARSVNSEIENIDLHTQDHCEPGRGDDECFFAPIPESDYQIKVRLSEKSVQRLGDQKDKYKTNVTIVIREMTRYLSDDLKCTLDCRIPSQEIGNCNRPRTWSHTNWGIDILDCHHGENLHTPTRDVPASGLDGWHSSGRYNYENVCMHRSLGVDSHKDKPCSVQSTGNDWVLVHEFAHSIRNNLSYVDIQKYGRWVDCWEIYSEIMTDPPDHISVIAGKNRDKEPNCGACHWTDGEGKPKRRQEHGMGSRGAPYPCTTKEELWAVSSTSWFGVSNERWPMFRFMETPEIMKHNFSEMYQYLCDVYNHNIPAGDPDKNTHRNLCDIDELKN